MSPGKGFRRFTCSKRGLAVPVTYLILFGSLLVLVSVTYGFALSQIRAKGILLGVAVAKQNMQALDDAIRLVAWNPGASKTVYMEGCGGVFQTEPRAGGLVLRLTDGSGFSTVVFRGSLGSAFYTLGSLPESREGLFVRGDGRAIVAQGASTQTQLYFARNGSAQQLVLRYRPMATALALGSNNGRPYNVIRVYVISLNKTQPLTLGGGFKLKVSAANVASITQSFLFMEAVSSIALEALYEGAKTLAWLPVASTSEGAVVNVEVYICSINFQAVS
ncbi:MAG: hypothetical protein NZ932_05800 [Candidatus Bathyarchaeota archaeon]|nr:hypothetical protein [Candidatus Bathyarchaeota archaeon]